MISHRVLIASISVAVCISFLLIPTDATTDELDDARNKANLLTGIFNSMFSETGEKFTNSKYGVDMDFPKNWTGFEMKLVPMALVSPVGFNITNIFSLINNATVNTDTENIVSDDAAELSEQENQELSESLSNKLTQEFENMTSTMGIFIHDKGIARLVNSLNTNTTMPVDSLTSIFERLILASDSTTSCDRKTLDRITLNDNISAEKSTQQCLFSDSDLKRNNMNYLVLTPNAIVGIIFSSDSNNPNEKHLLEFEEALKSLSIRESLPINNQTIEQFLNDDPNNNNDSSIVSDTGQNILDMFNGSELISQGKYEEAINLYDLTLGVDPNNTDALHDKGVALHYLGKYEEAISFYDKVLALDPKYVNALHGKGAALANLGRYEEAITWYDKALAEDPKNVDALNGKAFVLGKSGSMEEAIVWSDKALDVDPKNLDALNDKGGALGVLDRYEESIVWFDKALEVDPNNVRALTFKGLSLYNLGKKAEALISIDKALAIDPTSQMVLNVKSIVQG